LLIIFIKKNSRKEINNGNRKNKGKIRERRRIILARMAEYGRVKEDIIYNWIRFNVLPLKKIILNKL